MQVQTNLPDCQKGQLIAMAWADPEFKKQLINDPQTVVKNYYEIEFEGVIDFIERPLELDEETLLSELKKGTGVNLIGPLLSCCVPF